MDAGFAARATYRDNLQQIANEKKDVELQQQIASEKKRVEDLAKKDALRRSELQKLKEAEAKADEKKKAAAAKTIEAERKIQLAMA